MKKLVFASVLAGLCFSAALQLKAQDKIEIKDPAEYNAYQTAMGMTEPKSQASALEGFLTAYPQSVVKKMVLSQMIDAYQGAGDTAKELTAVDRLLQVDPSNMRAIFIGVALKKVQCGRTQDAAVCDDMAALAKKGLTVAKPADATDEEWKKATTGAYPAFHSAIAVDYTVAKKDFKAAIQEYRAALTLYPAEATTSGPAVNDTLLLAQAYAKTQDMVMAAWFYARVWNFAPANYKPELEKQMKYWYTRYHGKLDGGLDDIKAAAAKSLFKPDDFNVKPAPTPAETAHEALTGGDPKNLNLEDKEYILANGNKEDVDAIWNLIKGQTTPVPGVVIEASTTVIKVAVTQAAKDAKVADFIVNLKKPLEDKDVPAVGFEFKTQPAAELDATIDSFTPVPATATTAATAQIVAIDGFVQAEKKAKTPATGAKKPTAAHRAK